MWLRAYIQALCKRRLQKLVRYEFESEYFRFGNGGRLKSDRRFRIPICISGKPFMIQVSVVNSASLGALLGKDLARALGLKLDFENDEMESALMNLRPTALKEMKAGHYKLDLLDGVVKAWQNLSEHELQWTGLSGVLGYVANQHSSLQSSALKNKPCSHNLLRKNMCVLTAPPVGRTPFAGILPIEDAKSPIAEASVSTMDTFRRPPHRSSRLALAGRVAVALAAAAYTVLSSPVAELRNARTIFGSNPEVRECRIAPGSDRVAEQDGLRGCVLDERASVVGAENHEVQEGNVVGSQSFSQTRRNNDAVADFGKLLNISECKPRHWPLGTARRTSQGQSEFGGDRELPRVADGRPRRSAAQGIDQASCAVPSNRFADPYARCTSRTDWWRTECAGIGAARNRYQRPCLEEVPARPVVGAPDAGSPSRRNATSGLDSTGDSRSSNGVGSKRGRSHEGTDRLMSFVTELVKEPSGVQLLVRGQCETQVRQAQLLGVDFPAVCEALESETEISKAAENAMLDHDSPFMYRVSSPPFWNASLLTANQMLEHVAKCGMPTVGETLANPTDKECSSVIRRILQQTPIVVAFCFDREAQWSSIRKVASACVAKRFPVIVETTASVNLADLFGDADSNGVFLTLERWIAANGTVQTEILRAFVTDETLAKPYRTMMSNPSGPFWGNLLKKQFVTAVGVEMDSLDKKKTEKTVKFEANTAEPQDPDGDHPHGRCGKRCAGHV